MSEEIFSPGPGQMPPPPPAPSGVTNQLPPPTPAISVRKRRRWGVWIGVVIVLLAMAGGGLWWWLRPFDWEAVYSQNNRAIAIMDAFHYAEAIPEFEKVVRMAPDWPAGRINLGIALLNACGDDASLFPRCRTVFEDVLRRDPDDPHAHFCLGLLLMYQKDSKEAIQHFEAVLKKDPMDAYSWYWLAKHQLKRSDWENTVKVAYSRMGPYAEVIGRTSDQPPLPPTGPLALFQPDESLKVQLASGARWAQTADFGSDSTAEVRRLVRARFGATMVVLDYNIDGKPDLFLAGAVVEKGKMRDLLLRNEGHGRFTDVTAEAGLAEPRPTLGCCVGDVDNDGLPDLLLTGVGVQKLFRNRGEGKFEDVTAQATLDKLISVCLGATFVDLDQDSDLDILLCQFADNAKDAIEYLKREPYRGVRRGWEWGGGLHVYLHVGAPVETKTPFDKPPKLDCKFRKTSIAGLTEYVGENPRNPRLDKVMRSEKTVPWVGVALSDMDHDRDLDLLLLQDSRAARGAINDRLLHFHFSSIDGRGRWNGALAFDVDHDGRSEMLLLADGERPQVLFKERFEGPGERPVIWFRLAATNAPPLRHALAIDLNLDSWTDVVGLSRDGVPVLLHNEGGGLVYQPEALGRDADWPSDLVALTVCPLNAGRRPDLFVWSEKDGLHRYQNRDNGGHAVWVDLLGRNSVDGQNRLRCNADGIGVWAVAQSGGVWSGQENTTLSAGLGQSRQPMLFGIARHPGIEVLRLRWPDGTLQAEPDKLDTQHPPPDFRAGRLAQVLQRNRLPGSVHPPNGGFDDAIPAYRAHALAKLGRYAEALAEAGRCVGKPREAYHVACAYSLLSVATPLHDKLGRISQKTSPSQISEAQALRAIELLRGINWKDPSTLNYYIEPLKTDKDLDALRGRPDFRALVKQVDLDARLPALLKGQEQPKDASDRLSLAWLCQLRKHFIASSRWYSEAFSEEPKQAEDLNAKHRYNAACAAALAGCGQGTDADKLDAKERARLRQQALDWLRADLKAYRQMMEKSAEKAGPMIAKKMQDWLQDGDFAGVRGDKALAKLPEAERKDWQKLWEEVEAMRQRAAQSPKAASSARP